MTIKLYDASPHLRRFQAVVLSCVPCAEGYRIVLDQTAFFPGGGGQEPDRGRLGSYEVSRVLEEKEIIYHILPQSLAPGRTVTGEIDWDYRFTNMQQHSGEHILSGVIHASKGYDNVGFHMNDEITTIDFNGPLSPEELAEAEREANRVVCRNLPVTVFYPSAEELSAMSYRSKKELSGQVRIVQVGDCDLCACCAPHVASTGEVGMIKIVACENYKGGVRLTIVCGERAIRFSQQETALLSSLGNTLSTAPDRLPYTLEKHLSEETALKETIAALSEEVIQYRLQSVPASCKHVFLVENVLDSVAARRLVNELALRHPGRAAVLLPQDGGYRYIIGSNHEDLRPFAKIWNERFAGRGGGSASMIQGTVTGDPNEMSSLF